MKCSAFLAILLTASCMGQSTSISTNPVPTFGPSGSSHAQGAVPDPGATAGKTRYLREDGTWAGADPTLVTLQADWCFGDSWGHGTGATIAQTYGVCSLIAGSTPAQAYNYAQAGSLAPTQVVQVYQYYVPDANLPDSAWVDGGQNDGTNDACGGTTTSNCAKNFTFLEQAILARLSEPDYYHIWASTGTPSGTWTADTTLTTPSATYYNAIPYGTPMQSTVTNATETYTIPSSASPVVGVTYLVANAGTGTFSITIDGTAETDGCSSTTTFTAGPCGGQALIQTTTSLFRQEFSVTPNTSHTVVIKNLNGAKVNVTSVDYIPPSSNLPPNGNTNLVYAMGPNSYWQYSTTYDTLYSNVVTQLHNDGLPVFYISQLNGTPGVNNTTDISLTAGSSCPGCPGSQQAGHPSNWAYRNKVYATFLNVENSSGYLFTTIGASQPTASPYFVTGLNANTPGGAALNPGYMSTFNSQQSTPGAGGPLNGSLCAWMNAGQGDCWGLHYTGTQVANSITTWTSHAFALGFNNAPTAENAASATTPTNFNFVLTNTSLKVTSPSTFPYLIPGTLYSAAGTALPSCVVGIQGASATVSDATSPTYMGAYTSGGAITTAVICSYNGTTYSWLTH